MKTATSTFLLVAILVGLGTALGIKSAPALALDAEGYVRADLEARQLTVDGMRARVGLLEAGASRDAQLDAADAVRARVDDTFFRHGTNSGAHAAYGTHNDKAVRRWLRAHPEYETRYDDIEVEFERLSRQIRALLDDG